MRMIQTLKENPQLSDFQEHIKSVCKEFGWANNNHLEIFLLFSEEVGELAKAIRKQTELHSKTVDSNIEEEIADVFNYLLDIANYFGIDLEQAYRNKIDKIVEREKNVKLLNNK